MRAPHAVAVLLALLLTSLALAQPAQPWSAPFSSAKDAAYTCHRATQPIVLDGLLTDAAWQSAQLIEGFVVPPTMDWETSAMTPRRPASSASRVRLLWDDRYLYLGAELEDQDIYCRTPLSHDASFNVDDIIELFIKPSDTLPYYWELHVVPSGGTRDYFYARRGAGGDHRWLRYESGMQARVKVFGTLNDWEKRDTKWVVEMRVPWSAFKQNGGRPRPGDLWRFMVARYDYSVYLEDGCELSAAAPLPQQNFHLYEHFPYLKFAE
jgi:hypothetical protein